jgi:hypothetical protein
MLGDVREWEEQLNINALCARMNNLEVRAIKILVRLKDWKARKARLTGQDDYPPCPVHIVDLPLWNVGKAQEYVLERIKEQEDNQENPRVCNKRERWQRDATFALMKKGRKSAIKLYFNKDQAEAALNWCMEEGRRKPGESFYLEERQSEPVRCLDWCGVWQWCSFGIEARKKWREQNGGSE